MPEILRLVGGAGTGKTTELLRLMGLVLDAGVDPFEIGFCSLTKAARREASTRAAEQFGGAASTLETEGWFRTIHSCCFKLLGLTKSRVLSDDADSKAWLRDLFGDDMHVSRWGGDDAADEDKLAAYSPAGRSLAMWSTARSRMEPLRQTWESLSQTVRQNDKNFPDYEQCLGLVAAYERQKNVDDKIDFVDMLALYAGVKFSVTDTGTVIEEVPPEGENPGLKVWFFDEQQDISALADLVCHRLIEGSNWVYVVGDPFQSILAFSGADHRLFRAWDAKHEKVMPKSYRCPPAIHELGEQILRGCSDYWDRKIAPADHDGSVEYCKLELGLFADIDPRESWLLIARTHRICSTMISHLRRLEIPWTSTKDNGCWMRPKAVAALGAMHALSDGHPITGREWGILLDEVPSKHRETGRAIFERGAKLSWDMLENRRNGDLFELCTLAEVGASEFFIERIRSRNWSSLHANAEAYQRARKLCGPEILEEPRVRVGTIHSVKGSEADNVIWLTTLNGSVDRNCRTKDGEDEERRVAYVAATRARKRLIIAVDYNAEYKFQV